MTSKLCWLLALPVALAISCTDPSMTSVLTPSPEPLVVRQPAVPSDIPRDSDRAPTPLPTVVVPTPPAPSDHKPSEAESAVVTASTRLFRQKALDLPNSGLQNLEKDPGGLKLARSEKGAYVAKGTFTSELHRADFPFDEAVLSWNADAPRGTNLRFEMRIGKDSQLSPWFTIATWRDSGGSSARAQRNDWGYLDIDTLKLADKATSFQYRVTFTTDSVQASPILRSISLVYSDHSTKPYGPAVTVSNGWMRDLPVPQRSQLEEDAAVARSICSPTSLAMVLNFWGVNRSVREVYQSVRDAETGIFGNWALNVAYAGALGFDAYVDRFYSVEQIQNEIAAGRPVIASIQFKPGELDNSPISSTTGHLIVIRGFTPEGDFIVNDPIAPSSQTVRRVYKCSQLAKIWLDSGGIVYIIKPK